MNFSKRNLNKYDGLWEWRWSLPGWTNVTGSTKYDLTVKNRENKNININWVGKFFTKTEEISTPLQYFKKFSDEGWSIISHKYKLSWNFFFGIHIMSDIIPIYKMYWTISINADLMSRNSFETLKSNFYVNDNTEYKPRDHPQCDKLFKIRS